MPSMFAMAHGHSPHGLSPRNSERVCTDTLGQGPCKHGVQLRFSVLAVHHFVPQAPHFRHVVVSTFPPGSCIVVGWFGGSGHVDCSVFCDHGFTWRSGTSSRLRKSIATKRKSERREHLRSFYFRISVNRSILML